MNNVYGYISIELIQSYNVSTFVEKIVAFYGFELIIQQINLINLMLSTKHRKALIISILISYSKVPHDFFTQIM